MRRSGYFCLAYLCAIHGFALFLPFMLALLVVRYMSRVMT
jgi:hypothetical protein